MIGRRFSRKPENDQNVEPKSFDDFDLRLGDLMRGERATMGKSLLDVERDLRIKANYISAIENTDPSAFETPGFVAGYVRSYARYLNMDPDEAFSAFCRESGFAVAHGMSAEASGKRSTSREAVPVAGLDVERNPFTSPNTPFMPESGGILSDIEPRAVGSILVLVALICGIGFGGWSVLKEVQQVQVAPVDQAPVVLSDLDPVNSALAPSQVTVPASQSNTDALNRLYRPQALDVPVLVARDAPISTLDPREVGTLSVPGIPDTQLAGLPHQESGGVPVADSVPQVLENAAPGVTLVAVRPSWVRVRAADDTIIFEAIMESGQTYTVPATEEPPTLRTGESGAIYFSMNGQHYGPAGNRGTVTSGLPLSIDTLSTQYQVADIQQDKDLARVVAEASTLAATNP